MKEQPIAFKGVKNHLEVKFAPEIEFEYAKQCIIQKFNTSKNFFSSASKIVIYCDLNQNQQDELKAILKNEFGIDSIEFTEFVYPEPIEQNVIPKAVSKLKKLCPRLPKKESSPLASVIKAPRKREASNLDIISFNWASPPLKLNSGIHNLFQSNSLIVKETVRNGQRVEYDGDIIIIGDVNSGAIIVATGSIAVLGALRGTAHAGASGDSSTFVAASRLDPQQLRIGVHIAIAPEGNKKLNINYPEIACVQDQGEISISPLSNALKNTVKEESPRKKRKFN